MKERVQRLMDYKNDGTSSSDFDFIQQPEILNKELSHKDYI